MPRKKTEESNATFYIAVMDYSSGTIKMYEHIFPKNYTEDDVEFWLEVHNYKESECYYMISDKPIKINNFGNI